MSFNPMHPFPFSLFFLPLILMISIPAYATTSPYSPTDYFLLDCGSSSDTTSSDGRTWRRESATSNFSSSDAQKASFESTADRQEAAVEQVPYMTARIFKSQFTYTFPVSPGPKFLRLYFYPAVYSGIHESHFLFTVTSGVHTLLTNFSHLSVAAMDSIVVKEFIIHVRETALNITFSPSPSFYAFVNGIEVCSMPDNLYITGEPIPLVGTNYMFYLGNSTALETVYRLNVGGASFGGERDTGMFRSWQDDSSNIFGAAFGVTWQGDDSDVRYTPAAPPAYTAPTDVYSSWRSMGPIPSINLNYNLTWIFPVDSGFNYLVRLHFCEMVYITRVNERVFDIFLSNQTAQKKADVIAWSGGPGIPMYQDYVVYVPQDGSRWSGGEKHDLWLSLHPNMNSQPHFADAILNGVEIFKLNRSSGSLAGANPAPASIQLPLQPPELHDSKSKRLSELIIIGPALLFGISALLFFVYLFVLRKRKRVSSWGSGHAELMSRHFALSELREATNGFDDALVIGRGSSGNVYKGYINGGDIIVAIKRLKSKSNSKRSLTDEFLIEIKILSQLRHRHLVSLIGYCQEEGEIILVYDYLHHGTVHDHLYGADHDPLPWKQRLEICIDAARGLAYLHPIIHGDIKSTNILLDHKWVAKVSDFGLSEVGPTKVKGAFGCIDPEYRKTMKVTEKSDVFSFGVFMLEVICGRAAVKRIESCSNPFVPILANWVGDCIEKGRLDDEMIDPFVVAQIGDGCLKKFRETAFECLRDEGIQRPTMADVVGRLELALELQQNAVTLTVN